MNQHSQQQPTTSSRRRRSERAHQAILSAASELLEENGYLGVSIEAIAAKAGVGKQTIYRWWASKAALVMEAYAAQKARDITVPDTGVVQDDLKIFLQRLFVVQKITRTELTMAGLIAETQTDPELAEIFRKQFIAQRRAVVLQILERGVVRGELRGDLNLDLVVDAIYGPVLYRLLVAHAPLDDLFAEELVNQLMSGVRA